MTWMEDKGAERCGQCIASRGREDTVINLLSAGVLCPVDTYGFLKAITVVSATTTGTMLEGGFSGT